MADALLDELPQLSLTEALASMDKMHAALIKRAQQLLTWYENARVGKRFWARTLRLSSILLGCLATLVPMAVSIANGLVHGERWANALLPTASIFGLLAATSLLLDKYFGCSSSWMRMTMAHLELRARTQAFHLAWQGERLKLESAAQPREATPPLVPPPPLVPLPGAGPTQGGAPLPVQLPAPLPAYGPDPHAGLLEALRAAHALHLAFLDSLNSVEKGETQEWITEFKGTLAELERRMEEQRTTAVQQLPGRGAVRVTLEGAADLVDGRFELQLDDGEVQVGQGTGAVLPRVLAGLRVLSFKATRHSGAVVTLREMVKVEANQIADAKLKL